MGRRTGRGAAVWRAVVRSAVVGALLCVSSAVLPGRVAVAAPDVPSYAFADDVRSAPATTGTTGAARLEPGATYRSSLRGEDKAYYRLELDGMSDVYVSVTAIPRAGSPLSAGDGISVAVQDADSVTCSSDSVTVGTAVSPQPLTAWGARELLPGKGLCQKAGTYYVVVERTDTGSGTGSGEEDTDLSDGRSWDLELAPVSEAPLAKAAATRVPEVWDSSTPTPPVDEPVSVRGGAGFAEAAAVTQGVRSDEIVPGQTLFYKVPVDWGQQLSATVDLGSAEKNSGYVVDALEMTLYNPVRASVKDTGIGYGGSQKSASLPPAPPVGYANRYAPTDPTKSLRFAGSYYLVVHLAAQVADRFGEGPYGLTLRVRLGGSTQAGPGYARQSVPRGFFDVGAPDPVPSGDGGLAGADASGGGAPGGDPAMKAVAVGGIGTGSVLLMVLGVWTLTARRRAAAQMRVNAQNPTA
ncbi:hypothetical protein [Streptomyces sp. NBC_01334]|uniref:hypothetical protein n=1 Tax=Streptomyces sp. NBC_01334 TaxID=2903827 RepID=UPI002E11385D|nr:hypothetical protein OG736_22465 [Streptomyces sp. NBC_01334]